MPATKKRQQLFDVVAVHIKKKTVRLLDENLTIENAEGVVKLAVMRRGVDVEFYVEVPAGKYAEGDKWTGA